MSSKVPLPRIPRIEIKGQTPPLSPFKNENTLIQTNSSHFPKMLSSKNNHKKSYMGQPKCVTFAQLNFVCLHLKDETVQQFGDRIQRELLELEHHKSNK